MFDLDYVIDAIGWVGAVLVLVAYALVSTRRVEGDSLLFQLLNIVGSSLLLANTAYKGAYPSTSVNAIWIAIALFAISRRGARKGA